MGSDVVFITLGAVGQVTLMMTGSSSIFFEFRTYVIEGRMSEGRNYLNYLPPGPANRATPIDAVLLLHNDNNNRRKKTQNGFGLSKIG